MLAPSKLKSVRNWASFIAHCDALRLPEIGFSKYENALAKILTPYALNMFLMMFLELLSESLMKLLR